MLLYKLLRMNHWVKNTFIFLPLFFSGNFFDGTKFLTAFFVALGFSLITGFIYIVNDINDIKFDKLHPSKRFRPIASGKISIKNALLIGVILLVIGSLIIINISIYSLYLSLAYIFLNFAYSFKLKNVPIVDFFIVASGFVLRVFIGGDVGDIMLSQWMVLMIFLLSIFIAISKRRDDILYLEKNNSLHRQVIKEYSIEFIDKSLTIVSSVLIVSYLMFVTSNEVYLKYDSNYIFLTFVFVLAGILRYNQLTYVYELSGSPVKILFKDKFIKYTLLGWMIIFFFLIY